MPFSVSSLGELVRLALAVALVFALISCGGETKLADTNTEAPSQNSLDIDLALLSDTHAGSFTYTCHYFVDAETGMDTNPGSSPEAAWATVDRVAEYSRTQGFLPGDVICFRRGQRFVTQNAQFRSSGAENLPIILGAYGDSTQPRPRLSPSIPLHNSDNWQNLGNGRYLWPESHASWTVSGLWEDNVWLVVASDSSLADGSWFHAEGIGVFYRTNAGQPSDHELYLAKKYGILGFHQQSHITISDLALEYAGVGIAGSTLGVGGIGPGVAMHDITIRNCVLEYISTAIEFRSRSDNGVAYENHDISIIGNLIRDVRYAIRLHNGTNGPERTYNIQIKDNVIRNIAINGAYLAESATDIEAISIQNPVGAVISGNDVRYGIKESEGLVNSKGNRLASAGIILWRHDDSRLEKLRVINNRVHGMSRGILVGAGVSNQMGDILVANNIISGSEIGLKLNDFDTNNTYLAVFNTLHGNDVNLQLAPITGQTIVGNLSIDPVAHHVIASGAGGTSIMNSNGYFPDGPLFMRLNTADSSLTKVYDNLAAWQQAPPYDENSIASSNSQLLTQFPVEAEDFMLAADSIALDQVVLTNFDLASDFGDRVRTVGSASDLGAWEFQ